MTCTDPDKMHGAADGSPSSDYADDKEKTMKRPKPGTAKIESLGLEVDTTPVTVGMWRLVMGGVPVEVAKAEHPDDYPITYVSWNDAQEFCRKRGGGWRLLTEEEWETCCRAGSTEDRYGLLNEIAVYNREKLDAPVGTKAPNAWGLYDIIGLAWEWTSTIDGSTRVYRGGCWGLAYAGYLSASLRSTYAPEYRGNTLGLRCARPLLPKKEKTISRPMLCTQCHKRAHRTWYAYAPDGKTVTHRLCTMCWNVTFPGALREEGTPVVFHGLGMTDAEILRKAAEIWRDQATEDCVPWGSNGHLRLVASAVDTLADKLEAPPPPKTFTTKWTNADPRPTLKDGGYSRLYLWFEKTDFRATGRIDQVTDALNYLGGVLKPDEPWPADLYWTRLPEVDDA